MASKHKGYIFAAACSSAKQQISCLTIQHWAKKSWTSGIVWNLKGLYIRGNVQKVLNSIKITGYPVFLPLWSKKILEVWYFLKVLEGFGYPWFVAYSFYMEASKQEQEHLFGLFLWQLISNLIWKPLIQQHRISQVNQCQKKHFHINFKYKLQISFYILNKSTSSALVYDQGANCQRKIIL